MFKKLITLFFVSLLLTSCAGFEGSSKVNLHKYNYSQLKGWNNTNVYGGFKAFQKTCSALGSSKIRSEKVFSSNMNIWKDKCDKSKIAKNPTQFFEQNFIPYLVSYGKDPKGKFTGYFEKEIEASLTKSPAYRYPIYRAPSDSSLLNLKRRDIENGALEGKNLEIAYAKSAAQLYFLQIQGSGVLKLPDGKKLQIGFTAKNSGQYTSIGSQMLSEGLIQHGTADEIEQWLETHPVSGRTIMNSNDRYVYFALKNGGPYGSLGVELTEKASLAVDPAYMPLGAPIWLQTTLSANKQYFTRLMNAQDTGSGIKGPIRGDIYLGGDAVASTVASSQNSVGNYFILLPKEINASLYF